MLFPPALDKFDSSEPSAPWQVAADTLEPFFRGFQGTVERQGSKFVTWGRARVRQERNRFWIEIYELPIQTWVSDVLKALEKLEPSPDVGRKRKAEDTDQAKPAKPAERKQSAAANLVVDIQDLSSEHRICVRVQVAPAVLGKFVDLGLVGHEAVEVENKDLLVALGLSNSHSTTNMHGLVKPALIAARDEQIKVPRGPWTGQIGDHEELLTLDVWRDEPWILKMSRVSTLFVL